MFAQYCLWVRHHNVAAAEADGWVAIPCARPDHHDRYSTFMGWFRINEPPPAKYFSSPQAQLDALAIIGMSAVSEALEDGQFQP